MATKPKPRKEESITESVLAGFAGGGRHHRSIYIRSTDLKNDDDPTNTDLTVRLDEPISVSPLQEITAHCTTLTVPFSFYNISDNFENSNLEWSYTGKNTSDATATITGTIALGGRNHSIYSFITAFKDQINDALIAGDMCADDGDLNPLVMSYIRSSSRLATSLQTNGSATYGDLPDGTMTWLLSDASTGSAFHKLLGESKGIDVSFSTSATLTSAFCVNLNTVTGLILNVRIY